MRPWFIPATHPLYLAKLTCNVWNSHVFIALHPIARCEAANTIRQEMELVLVCGGGGQVANLNNIWKSFFSFENSQVLVQGRVLTGGGGGMLIVRSQLFRCDTFSKFCYIQFISLLLLLKYHFIWPEHLRSSIGEFRFQTRTQNRPHAQAQMSSEGFKIGHLPWWP